MTFKELLTEQARAWHAVRREILYLYSHPGTKAGRIHVAVVI